MLHDIKLTNFKILVLMPVNANSPIYDTHESDILYLGKKRIELFKVSYRQL